MEYKALCKHLKTAKDSSMAATDPAFKKVDTKKSGFYIWRIENLKVVQVPKERYGEFYKGDSYIILSVKEIKGSSLDIHVHFWLGSETSQDEAGVAAFKTVELDDLLGGSPVQHREVDTQESQRFLRYFPKGIRTKKGGVKSGFNHVDNAFEPRLIKVKGKRNPRYTEMEEIDWNQMNKGDCFILDIGEVLFPWIGSSSNRTERMKTFEYCRQLRDERGGEKKVNIVPLEEGKEDKDMDKETKIVFEKYLKLQERHKLKTADAGGKDETAEQNFAASIKLFSCREEEGTLKIQEVKSGPLSKKDLASDDSFIIDNGSAGSWVWIGKRASDKEKKQAMRNAVGFLKKKGYPTDTQVTRVVEGAEPSDFKCLFRDWPQPAPTGKVYTSSRIAKTVQTKFDANTLHSNNALAAETQMVDDGSGKVEVWRVEDFDLKLMDQSRYGEFFGGDCYVIQYTYQVQGRENYIIYYWLGGKSTSDEKGTAALKAVEMDDKLGGAAVQVRVVQYKEPPHFMAMFGGKMIVFQGGKAGWTAGEQSVDGPGDKYMLQVRGTSTHSTKAVQVDLRASSLNSNDVFVIFTKTAVYIWAGKGCTGDEREMAKTVAERSPRGVTMVFEGQEKDDFWSVIGGKENYASEKILQDEGSHPPRLFQISNASGNVKAEEIIDFVQDDLIPEDVMLLDCWECLYLWVGKGSNKIERQAAQGLSMDYLKTDPAGRDPDTPILKISQGFEPPSFTGFFGVWNRDLWSSGMSYEEMKKKLGESNVPIQQIQQNGADKTQSFSDMPKYSFEELSVADPEQLPTGVDPTARELHLREEDFKRIFGMSYSDFSQKPAWKQKDMKKNSKLF
ncbi:advillin-like isoform X2 [Babylonia areolata]|uniref:advillin-like isoform X2 n=1 Tax=Babylonia areolata TaxID=304850 RepID=UPI003FD1D329